MPRAHAAGGRVGGRAHATPRALGVAAVQGSGRAQGAGAPTQPRLPSPRPERPQDDGFPERSIIAARAHYHAM